jgi:hypothetical protein
MGDALKTIRDFTIILAIYLYFIAWVYVHFYYGQFGISTSAIQIDYNSYLIFSYYVVSSAQFLSWISLLAGVIIILIILAELVRRPPAKIQFLKNFSGWLKAKTSLVNAWNFFNRYRLLCFIIVSILIFPKLFSISREVAIANYREDRLTTQNLKTIEFIFRADAEFLSPTVVLDTTLSPQNNLYNDIRVIKNDSTQILRLLGQSDEYYIVLQQRPYNKQLGSLPTGYVYFIDKKDVLLAKIVLRSL